MPWSGDGRAATVTVRPRRGTRSSRRPGAWPTPSVRSLASTCGSWTSSQSQNCRKETSRTSFLSGHVLERLLDGVHVDAAVPLLEVVADEEGRAVGLVGPLEAGDVGVGGLLAPARVVGGRAPWWSSSTGWRGCCSPSRAPRRSGRGTGICWSGRSQMPCFFARPDLEAAGRAGVVAPAELRGRSAAGCPGRADRAYGRRRVPCGSRRAAAPGCRWCSHARSPRGPR